MLILRVYKTTIRILQTYRKIHNTISSTMQTLSKDKISKDVHMGRKFQKQTLHGLWWLVRVLSNAVRSSKSFRKEISNKSAWWTKQDQFVQRNKEMRCSLCELSLFANSTKAL